MAILVHCLTGNKAYLRTPHVFGRSSGANTVLDNLDASQIHASIRWTGQRWEVNDHSRNGTQIDRHRLSNGEVEPIAVGQILQFGVDDHARWRVESVDPPVPMLVSVRGQGESIRLKEFNLLPNELVPELSLYLSPQGQWVVEDDHSIMAIHDGEVMTLGGELWRFLASPTVDVTLDAMPRAYDLTRDVLFEFHVSQDEEHTTVNVQMQGRKIDLGERSHHYCLLTLARKRLADALVLPDPDSQGWVELKVLARMLGLEPSHVNIQIFRARNQMSEAFPQGIPLPNVIERRRGSVRFSAHRFVIVRGSQVEGRYPIGVDAAVSTSTSSAVDSSRHEQPLPLGSA